MKVISEDVGFVLQNHGYRGPLTAAQIYGALVEPKSSGIMENLQAYSDTNQQMNSLYDDIENILIHEKIIGGPKIFCPPEDDFTEEDAIDT